MKLVTKWYLLSFFTLLLVANEKATTTIVNAKHTTVNIVDETEAVVLIFQSYKLLIKLR